MPDNIEQEELSGAAPLEVYYYAIKTTARRERFALHSELFINDPLMGTIIPERYEVVANRTVQCVKLSSWAFKKVISDSERIFSVSSPPSFVGIYMPTRMILKDYLEKLLSAAAEEECPHISKICFEISSNILLEDTELVKQRMEMFKKDYGVKFMLSTYGDAFCPTQRIEGLPFDYVLLDQSVSDEDSLCKSSVQSAVKLVNELKITSILNKTQDTSAVNKAFSVGCALYLQNKSQPIGELY